MSTSGAYSTQLRLPRDFSLRHIKFICLVTYNVVEGVVSSVRLDPRGGKSTQDPKYAPGNLNPPRKSPLLRSVTIVFQESQANISRSLLKLI